MKTDTRAKIVAAAKTETEGSAVREEVRKASRSLKFSVVTKSVMKMNKGKSNGTSAYANVTGPFVAIGSRGVTCPPIEKMFEKGIELNTMNPLPAKTRWGSDMPGQPLWRASHSWVQSRKTPDGKEPKFFFGELAYAVKHKLVQIIENVKVERKVDPADLPEQIVQAYGHLPKTAIGTVVLPKDWAPGQKQPRNIGFLPNKGQKWPGGRVESQSVNEEDPRNLAFIGKVIWPEDVAAKAKKAEDKAEKSKGKSTGSKTADKKKEAAKTAKPATRKEAVAAVTKAAEAVAA